MKPCCKCNAKIDGGKVICSDCHNEINNGWTSVLEENKPLTLDELKTGSGQSIWIEHTGHKNVIDLKNVNWITGLVFSFENYGTAWLAYRHKGCAVPADYHKSNAQECLRKITDGLLGKDFYIASPMGGNQANKYIAELIVEKYGR